jgi:hypothetical protein
MSMREANRFDTGRSRWQVCTQEAPYQGMSRKRASRRVHRKKSLEIGAQHSTFCSRWSCPGPTWAAEALWLHSPSDWPCCAAEVDHLAGCRSTGGTD